MSTKINLGNSPFLIDNMVFTVKNSDSPKTDSETYTLWVIQARSIFDVINPTENQVTAVSLYGADSVELKGLI